MIGKKYVLGLLFVACALSAAYSVEDPYTSQEKAYMLNLARQTLFWHLKYGRSKPSPQSAGLSSALREKRPCFVTLNHFLTGLRGCIGMFEFDQPLYQNIISRSIAAATMDSRFPPVPADNLRYIKIEISILTEPKKLTFTSAEELLEKLHAGEDGVILYTPYGTSTFLPQVWGQLPSKDAFLSHLCRKQGAPEKYWRTHVKNIEIEIYHAIHFQEDGYGRVAIGPEGAVAGKGGAMILGAARLSDAATARKVPEGFVLEPGMIISADSDYRENTKNKEG